MHTDPTPLLEVRIIRELHRALRIHGANPVFLAEVRKRTTADDELISRAHDMLERLDASRWLLATIGSWREGAPDEQTYECLKALNEGRFAVDITAT